MKRKRLFQNNNGGYMWRWVKLGDYYILEGSLVRLMVCDFERKSVVFQHVEGGRYRVRNIEIKTGNPSRDLYCKLGHINGDCQYLGPWLNEYITNKCANDFDEANRWWNAFCGRNAL